jgi:hypothetical protein
VIYFAPALFFAYLAALCTADVLKHEIGRPDETYIDDRHLLACEP